MVLHSVSCFDRDLKEQGPRSRVVKVQSEIGMIKSLLFLSLNPPLTLQQCELCSVRLHNVVINIKRGLWSLQGRA